MSAISISRKALPVVTFARESKPMVGIGDNGQMRFSTALTNEIIGKCPFAILTWDAESRELRIIPVMVPPKGQTEEDLFQLKRGKDGESKQAYFGASALLSAKEIGINYDYKASGTQMFEPRTGALKSGNKFIAITIPEGALTPRPKVIRGKKAATPATPAATPAATDDEDID